MNILIFVERINYSGASKIAMWVASRLAESGNDVTILSRLKNTSFYEAPSNVSTITLGMEEMRKLTKPFFYIRNIRKILKNGSFDIMISFLPFESALAVLSAVGINVPVIFAERSDPYFEKSKIASFCRFLCRFADGAVFQTDMAKEFYPKRLKEKSCVIPNPAFKISGDILEYSKRRLVVTYSGRLYIKQKRQDILLKAFSLVVEKLPTAMLEIYGDGPDEEKLKHISHEMGINGNVFFMGKTKDVANKVMDSRLFVFSSDYEGIPNSIIEALSVGTPVVSTDCSPGGAKILITNEINGYIVPREDYVELAEKIIYILCNNDIARSMSQQAKEVTQKYAEDRIFRKWERYISKVYE